MEIVRYAKLLGQRKTSRIFCISQKRIHEWIKLYSSQIEPVTYPNVHTTSLGQASKREHHAAETVTSSQQQREDSQKRLRESTESVGISPMQKISPQSSKQVLDLSVETEIYEWVQSLEVQPSSTEIRTKAMELYRAKGYDQIKCSYGWYRRWSERFKIWTSSHDNSDPLVLAWLLEQYDNNVLVTYSSLQAFGQLTLTRIKPAFKASPGWAARFLKRHHVFLNWDGYNDKELPQVLQERVEDFHNKLTLVSWQEFDAKQIGCMDEISLSFAGSKGIKDCVEGGIKTSRLKKVSVKNCDATVILALRADGKMLPPMVVVKAQKSSSLNQVYSINDSPVIVFYSKTTEPTISALDKWMELIWLKIVNVPNVLFYDSYDLHQTMGSKTNDVKKIIFPAGCSCKLQPINVYAKLTFQRLVDSYWEEYMHANKAVSKIQLPSTNEIVEWISRAYETLNTDVHQVKLKDSFKRVKLLPDNKIIN